MRLRPGLRLKVSACVAVTALWVVVPQARAVTPGPHPLRVLQDDVVPLAGRVVQLGELSHSAYLRLALTLVARNRSDLDAYVAAAADPGSPWYRHYLSGSQFTARYGRSIGEIDRLRRFLERNGFHIDDVHSGRLVVDASATAAEVERTFGIRLDTWRDESTGRVFYGNTTAPKLPADPGLLVADIAGLSDRALLEPTVTFGRPGGLTAGELRNSYGGAPVAHNRSGPWPRVALLEFAGFRPQDVAVYDRRFTPRSPGPELRLVDGGPHDRDPGQDAVDAEIETVQAMAPTAATEVFAAENSPAGELDAWQNVVDAGMTVAMTGWGAPEGLRTRSGMRAIDLVMEETAAEGIGVYSASAGYGRRDPGGTDADVFFPASDPYVTAVGLVDHSLGAGGRPDGAGRSTAFSQPWWQTRWAGADPHGRRTVPDVAVKLSPGVAVHVAGHWRTAAGSGVATAMWTALAALFDQRATACHERPPGFAAPALYQQARSGVSPAGTTDETGPWMVDGVRLPAPSPCPNLQNG